MGHDCYLQVLQFNHGILRAAPTLMTKPAKEKEGQVKQNEYGNLK